MLSNATNQPKKTVELGYMCPRRLLGPPKVKSYGRRLLQNENNFIKLYSSCRIPVASLSVDHHMIYGASAISVYFATAL